MSLEMVTYYAERAAEYDDIYQISPQSSVIALKEQIPPFFAGRRVFEVACGTGYWTQYAAQQALSIYATDINSTTLDIARARTYDSPADITFAIHDTYALHPELGRFSAGLAGFWLSHVDMSRFGDFLGVFHAYLEPGACVLMFDERLTSNRRLPTSRTDEVGNRYELRQLSSKAEFEIIKNFYDEAQLREWFGEYGHEFSYQELKYSGCSVTRFADGCKSHTDASFQES